MTAIRRGYFEYVVLNNDPADSFDAKVIPVLIADPQYRLLDSPPGFFVWAHVPRVRR
jgi:hypothetical protein